MSRKLKGFSLAELLISLLIISIVLSAAIPTITKKSGASRENIWHWTDQNNSIYAGTGLNQSAIIGLDRVPTVASGKLEGSSNDYSLPSSVDPISSHTAAESWPIDNMLLHNYTSEGNKLVILRRPALSGQSQFMNSHIAFYTAKDDGFGYAGRISSDANSLAFGIGSLINQSATAGDNTAIGHLSLLENINGARNTALGRKTLTRNQYGSYNTALGFGSLFKLGMGETWSQNTNAASDNGNTLSHNTAVGSMALKENTNGKQNTAVGSYALSNIGSGRYNTALGFSACGQRASGSYNVCIGNDAGNESVKDANNKTVTNYGLYIGSPVGSGTSAGGSILTGSLQRHSEGSDTVDKFLSVNAKRFELRPFDASFPLFNFTMFAGAGSEGYETGANKARFGFADFNLREDQGKNSTLRMQFMAPYNNNFAQIMVYDPHQTTATAMHLRDLNFSNMLTFDFPGTVYLNGKETTTSDTVSIRAQVPPNKLNPVKADFASGGRFKLMLNDVMSLDAAGKKITFYPDTPSTNGTSITEEDDKYIILARNNTAKPLNFLIGTSKLSFKTDDYDIRLNADSSGNNNNNFMISKANGIFYKSDTTYINTKDKDLFIGGFNLDDGKTLTMHTSGSKIDIVNGDIVLRGANQFASDGSIKKSFQEIDRQIRQLIGRVGGYSDARLKNITGDNTAGLKEINALEVKNYTYKKDKKKTPHVGVIAQQLQKIFPDAVTKDEDGYLLIRTEDIFYAMVNSIKELTKQIQDLTAKVTGLDKRIAELEKQNKQLQEQNKAFEKRLAKLEKQAAKK